MPMVTKYPLEINGVDFSHMVERDSYVTSIHVVYSDTITTMDGVDHVAAIRNRGVLTVKFNPQTSANTAKLCTALLKCPLQVRYHCLQRDMDVYATMIIDSVSSQYLSRVLYMGQKWNETKSITFKEL